MKEITAFGCDYCSMVSRIKYSVTRHEKNYCRLSPVRINCQGCRHMIFERGTNDFDISQATAYQSDEWYCDKLDESLNGLTINMNIECDFFDAK